MARLKGRTGSATNLYLAHDLKAAAGRLAMQEDKSLSNLIEELLAKRVAAWRRKQERRVA